MTDVNINGTLKPTQAGTPTHVADLGDGGFRSVADITERDAIHPDFKTNGLGVYVVSEEKLYTWDGGSWNNPILFGGDVDFSTATNGQTLIYNSFLDEWELGVIEGSVAPGSILGSAIIPGTITSIEIGMDAVSASELAPLSVFNYHLTPSCIEYDSLDYSVIETLASIVYVNDTFVRSGTGVPLAVRFETPSGDGYPGYVGAVSIDDEYMYMCISADDLAVPVSEWERIAWDAKPWV